jgi:hypothetical protein
MIFLNSIFPYSKLFISNKGCTILEELQITDFLFRNDGSSEGISFPNLVSANISSVSLVGIIFHLLGFAMQSL